MGYRKVPTIYSLSFAEEEYEGLEVRMKGLKVGKIRKLMTAIHGEDDGESAVSEMLDLLEEGLVSWNLEEEDGTPVEAGRAGIDDLEMPFVLDILHTWLDGMTGTSGDLGKDSEHGETSPVLLPTMELL